MIRRLVIHFTYESGNVANAESVIHSAAAMASTIRVRHSASTPSAGRERSQIMSKFTRTLRNHQIAARNRRAVNRAIDEASTPAMRNELIVMAQNQGVIDR